MCSTSKQVSVLFEQHYCSGIRLFLVNLKKKKKNNEKTNAGCQSTPPSKHYARRGRSKIFFHLPAVPARSPSGCSSVNQRMKMEMPVFWMPVSMAMAITSSMDLDKQQQEVQTLTLKNAVLHLRLSSCCFTSCKSWPACSRTRSPARGAPSRRRSPSSS